jgi:hypothetical protein
MKYRYIGDAYMQVKAPDPQTGERVGLNTGDTVELDWLPGGTKHVLIPVVEEAPKVKETPKIVKPKVKASKKKKKG